MATTTIRRRLLVLAILEEETRGETATTRTDRERPALRPPHKTNAIVCAEEEAPESWRAA